MSFTPYGAGGEVSGIPSCHFPAVDPCCTYRERRCASVPYFYNVKYPPWFRCPPKCPTMKKPLIKRAPNSAEGWYNRDYLHYSVEDLVMPIRAFWHYADSVPDPGNPCQPSQKRPIQCPGRDNQKPPWPPLAQGTCPAPRECQPCGPGPWGNPNLRKFFFYDCV